MERGESVIKLLHSIWKWNIFWILPLYHFFSPSLSISAKSLQRLCKQWRSHSCSSVRPSVHPKPHTSTWNDGWWNYSENIDLLSAETLSRSPNGLGSYSDSCFCSGAGGARDHLETHEDKMETGLFLLWWLMNKWFILDLCGFYLWKYHETFYCCFYYSWIFLHSFIMIIYFIVF